ncbi:cyclophilin-like protein [Guyanagaster necrorhizus]|uniref:Peptidyl-prolyl cis-trans isomerase n=1 Tax=Guyanagaster necrorhizus TaxID=856835 RepID=A0A9P7VWG7_9AGAR|nr:cyclophilin-like protein [Guyanagaster necrorhizus MCA 3950]KAG7447705.1 cyclophilin-like protein [Guyanagaster necrorhizus MCA 3950]
MSVLLETSVSDLVIDSEVETCPKTCENFLKLCKVHYYTLGTFSHISKGFFAQAGDPSATGTGRESIWSLIASQSLSNASAPRCFSPELHPGLKHTHKGTVSIAVGSGAQGMRRGCASQFFVTLSDNIDFLNGEHAVFGHVVEGPDTLDRLNDISVGPNGRPLEDVQIRRVVMTIRFLILGDWSCHLHLPHNHYLLALRLWMSLETASVLFAFVVGHHLLIYGTLV